MVMMENIQDLYEALKDNQYFQYFNVKKQYEQRNMTREELIALYKKENQEMAPYMKKYENPFMNIMSFTDKLFDMFTKEDYIVIQEKIDGSNTHLNAEGDSFTCYSNRCVLNEKNHLQGYWFWCQNHYRQIPKEYFGLDIYGEWLTPHHCGYPASQYGEFYVFDVMEHGKYWLQERVAHLAEICGFRYAPVFFEGNFQSWEHLLTFVGKTMMGGKKGEGIVVKNQTTLNSTAKEFYIKIVDEEFQETNNSAQKIKKVDLTGVAKRERQRSLSESIVTIPRVRKLIFKLVDEKELPSEWKKMTDEELLKMVKPYVYKNCLKEEEKTVKEIGNSFGMHCGDFTLQAIQRLKEA